MDEALNRTGHRCCPHCGGETFYLTLRVSGTIRERHRFDGEFADNHDMWDSAQLREQKTIRCNDCDRRISPSK